MKPLSIRDFSRLVWHTQLATHNGGDFFNEIFDGHPNLLAAPSVMFDSIEETVGKIEAALKSSASAREAVKNLPDWSVKTVEELYLLRDRTGKDILVAMFLNEKGGRGFSGQVRPHRARRVFPAPLLQHSLHHDGGFGDRPPCHALLRAV